ncbi:MAG: endonuclease VIII [Myxococcota bacterium]
MPEGPEIAREADQIRAAIGEQRVGAVRFAFPHLAKREAAFEGAQVLSVRARGKAMLISFDNELTIYSHNQLYGRWYIRKAGALPRTSRQLRLAIEGEAKWALLYSASEIEVLDEAGLAFHPYLTKLGPDALDLETDASMIVARLEDDRFRRRGLGGLLLDQAFVAGLGNYLRSEIFFEARLHPAQRPGDLDPASRRRLGKAILVMARRAYETKGVTLPKTRAAKLRAGGSTWRHARHWVFARKGQPCRRCEEPIERFDLAGRRVYCCSVCQPPRS